MDKKNVMWAVIGAIVACLCCSLFYAVIFAKLLMDSGAAGSL
jgi:hypothetical protein